MKKTTFIIKLSAIVLLSSYISTLHAEDVIRRGERIIAIDVSTDASGNYDKAIAIAKSAGMTQIGLLQTWSVLEPSAGKFDANWLDMAANYYPAQGIKVDLTIAPINTNQKEFPKDLMDKTFDDPKVIERFKRLLDFIFSRTAKLELSSINIGSEIDVYFGQDKKKWQQYEKFYKAVVDYIHSKRPKLPVTTEPTFKGLIGYAKDSLKSVNRYSDAIAVSYYPLQEDGMVKKPTAVYADFDTITKLYPHKYIFFFQFGYPSSLKLESSEATQADFIRHTFKAWDKHAQQIRLIDFTWLHDGSSASIKKTSNYYGVSDQKFSEFIGTLGLRQQNGNDKEAFQVLLTETMARNWREVGGIPFSSAVSVNQPQENFSYIGFVRRQDLFQCPGAHVALEKTMMRWAFEYSKDWLWCTKNIQGTNQARHLEFKVHSDVKGPIFVQFTDDGGNTFFAIVHVVLSPQKVKLVLSDLKPDRVKKKDGHLDPSRLASLLIADDGATTGKRGKRVIWFSDMALTP